ncbi:hypothetical protein AK812_SmicGene25821 [Symbiodinium microadriaticum]|uniref:Uncharacterized protein n=1 Tax=Symbiodinium microadriaticum TaxID=2951 RepID=A0A1Q9DB22_SYMMI|nr:hypothetical protein AK812_SmicGene25821 [Symbiodinium microadriaticum]
MSAKARRLLTVDLRDQLVQITGATLSAAVGRSRTEDVRRLWYQIKAFAADVEEEHVLARVSVEAWVLQLTAKLRTRLALRLFDVPIGDEVAWKRPERNSFMYARTAMVVHLQGLGPEIKQYLEGLTDAVQSLIEELDCEKTFYNEAWAAHGLGPEHLAVSAAAVVVAVGAPTCGEAESWSVANGPASLRGDIGKQDFCQGPPILEVPPGGGVGILDHGPWAGEDAGMQRLGHGALRWEGKEVDVLDTGAGGAYPGYVLYGTCS